jgi:hypothetical protein
LAPGVRAPDALAAEFTRERARAVRDKLMECGVSKERILAMGWGKQVAAALRWKPGLESAVAELFVQCDGLSFPPLREVYLPGGPTELKGYAVSEAASKPASPSDSSEEDGMYAADDSDESPL